MSSHENTTEHLQAIARIQSDSLHRQAMEIEAAKEAIPTQAMNTERLPAVQLPPQRSQIPSHEEADFNDFHHFDDVVFSAGQEVIDRYESRLEKTWAHEYALDKYGNEADDIDITINQVSEDLDRKGMLSE